MCRAYLVMPLLPTFDMAAADLLDFGLEEELPELEPEEGATADPGPTLPPGLGELLRCADCDGNDFLPDYLGRPRCRTCGSFVQYRVDRPMTRQAQHGQGQWHYVPAGHAPPPAPGPRPGDDDAGGLPPPRRRRRNRRPRGGPPPGDGASERSEQAESETLTYDPTVSAGESSATSRRARRHDPWAGWAPAGRPLPRQAPPVLPERPDRAQVKTACADLDQDLAHENLEHPQHLSLGDMRAASSPRKKDSTSTPSWNSSTGPEKNVRWRGGTPPSPPTWRYDVTDLRAFSKWSRKVQIWEMQIKTYMTPREASLLYSSLSGEAEAELEHAPLDKINCDSSIQYILESLRAPMEQKAVYQKRKFLSDFEQLSRYPGEGLRTYEIPPRRKITGSFGSQYHRHV